MTDRDELVYALQAIPWFHELLPIHFEKLVNIARLREVEAGEELFQEGDQEDFLYIVLEGRVAIDIAIPGHGRRRISTVEPTEFFGWSSVTPVVHQRTARGCAVITSRLICLDASELRKICAEDHDLGYVVMQQITNVVTRRLVATRLQLLDMFANPDS